MKPSKPPPGGVEVERRLENLRQERERLGAVNLRADDELVEVLGARDKLIAERDDLTEAIKRLRTAIGTLNQEGRERLVAAFDVVNGHFKELFSTLFEGGQAELQLIESDDPLEAGLELLAQPPGKKPQTLTLLSGGEQALTALALIFAVFLTNPSPICVLDEVDAPLDDYNVERFCDLLEAMRKRADTRFVAITHNPDHHGAHGPPVRRHHGRARGEPARVGRAGGGAGVRRGGVSVMFVHAAPPRPTPRLRTVRRPRAFPDAAIRATCRTRRPVGAPNSRNARAKEAGSRKGSIVEPDSRTSFEQSWVPVCPLLKRTLDFVGLDDCELNDLASASSSCYLFGSVSGLRPMPV